MPIRVAIVEDNRALRESLAALINGAPGFACAGAHATATAALERLPQEKPDVVLMDIGLPDGSGIDCVRDLSARLPQTPILMLTIEQDTCEVFRALEAGACGYLLKDVPFDAILRHVQEVHSGGAPMSPQVARHVIRFFHGRGRSGRDLENLTPREEEVLRLLSQGYRDKEIADRLGCTARTIAAHCHSIYRKLHVRSRAAAVAKYLRA